MRERATEKKKKSRPEQTVREEESGESKIKKVRDEEVNQSVSYRVER